MQDVPQQRRAAWANNSSDIFNMKPSNQSNNTNNSNRNVQKVQSKNNIFQFDNNDDNDANNALLMGNNNSNAYMGDRSSAPPPRASTPTNRMNKNTNKMNINNNAVDVNTLDIMTRLREKIIGRSGSAGMLTLTRMLKIMDNNDDKKLSKEELHFGLRDIGVSLSSAELEAIFAYFDRDRNGSVDINEFLYALRGDLNMRRKKLIYMAFDSIDVDGSGEVDVDEVVGAYDFSQHPEVKAGAKTVKQAAREFMTVWDRLETDGIGIFMHV